MRPVVQFGQESIELDVPEHRLVELSAVPAMRTIDDISRVAADAIESPLEFPALRSAVVPGDHVALVLDPAVPHGADLLEPLVECMREAGVQPHDIEVVAAVSHADASNSLSQDALPPDIRLLPHHPSDRNRLSYLATTKSGRRIYLNRSVVDADLAVLVGQVDFDPILGFSGTSSVVFPGLADEAARHDFRSRIHRSITPETMAAGRAEADEVAWLLGVQFALQVVRGRNDHVLAVFGGACASVQREAERLLTRHWTRAAKQRVDTVVMSLGTKEDEQDFEQLGHVLQNATRLVVDGGRIVVLSAIGTEPGPALQLIRTIDEPRQWLDQLTKVRHADVITAHQIAEACQRARVYLHSRLATDLVEDLKMTPIETAAEVRRLVDQAAKCIIVPDAQRTRTQLEVDNG